MTKQKPATPRDQLETELANLIFRHSDWIDGQAFLSAALETAEGLFDDITPGGLAAYRRAMLRTVP